MLTMHSSTFHSHTYFAPRPPLYCRWSQKPPTAAAIAAEVVFLVAAAATASALAVAVAVVATVIAVVAAVAVIAIVSTVVAVVSTVALIFLISPNFRQGFGSRIGSGIRSLRGFD